MAGFFHFDKDKQSSDDSVSDICMKLSAIPLRGDMGREIAGIVLKYSPKDLKQMRVNFSGKIDSFPADYKKELENTIAAFLDGTYQAIRLMNQQGSFADAGPCLFGRDYWAMVRSNVQGSEQEKTSTLKIPPFWFLHVCPGDTRPSCGDAFSRRG